jgi:hypothetical protein
VKLKMRIFLILMAVSIANLATGDDTTPTPPNQNDVKVDNNPPKAGVTGVQTQSAGIHTGQGSLDPSQQSSMGVGIQFPFHKEKEVPPSANLKKSDGDSSTQ